MINIQSYEMLNFSACCLVVSRKEVSRMRLPSLLAALTKLKNYKNISLVELIEILSDFGLSPVVHVQY